MLNTFIQKIKKLGGNNMNKFAKLMNEEHQGAVAFEYIIILVIMAVAVFTAWGVLSKAITDKATQIQTFIKNNGQSSLGR